jgi:hypothetical protein
MLWDQSLGHIGEKGLQTLKNKNLVDGLNDFLLNFIFASTAYMENRTMFNFILVLTNLLACWN